MLQTLKKSTLKIGKCQVQLLPLLLTILAFVILLSLGFWQIARLQEKELFLSSMKNNLNNPPIDIKTLSGHKLYAKIRANGHFLVGKNLHLYGRRSMSTEKDGYYLVTPFQTDDNKIILVVLGWFAGRHKENIDNIINNSMEITGVILPGEKTKLFVLDNDVKNNVWFTLDLTQGSDVLGLKLEDFYLIMEGNNNRSDILKSLSIENLLNVRNDHLEYAITWFALAISLAVIFVICNLSKRN
ncbi:SURF1 family protein [Candidatus Tisiphia endosymbiont of Micropterix aruncella]|uniref:SURF1 family protein n=1 Tax=Candidatus Tisiphia endosymbiont of Micropterix aruncella TaxID=3066271 RepID=UPI003AA853DC